MKSIYRLLIALSVTIVLLCLTFVYGHDGLVVFCLFPFLAASGVYTVVLLDDIHERKKINSNRKRLVVESSMRDKRFVGVAQKKKIANNISARTATRTQFDKKWKQSPWWGGLPTDSPMMIDTCVWMDEAQEIELWFEWLKQNVRAGKVRVHLLANVYEEIINNAKAHDTKKSFLARIAKKRVFELQQQTLNVENFRILNLTAEGIKNKEELYADPEIIKFMLDNPSYVLYTSDLDLQIRVTQMAREKGSHVRVESKNAMLLAGGVSLGQLRSACKTYSTI